MCVSVWAIVWLQFVIYSVSDWSMGSSRRTKPSVSWLTLRVGRSCWGSVNPTLNRVNVQTSVDISHLLSWSLTLTQVHFSLCSICRHQWIEVSVPSALHCVSKKWGTHIAPINSHKCGPIVIRVAPNFGFGKSDIQPFFPIRPNSAPDKFLAGFGRCQCNWSAFS